MKRIGIAVLSAASLMAAGTAMAEPQWTYAQLGWIQGDGFDNDGKSDGFEFKGSVGVQNFHFGLSYIDGEIDGGEGSNDTDFDGYNLTAGFHQALTSSGNTQLVAELGYFDIDADWSWDGGEGYRETFDGENKGWSLGLGVRSTVLDKLELEAMITYIRGEAESTYRDIVDGDVVDVWNYEDDYTDTGLRVGARYHWTGNLSTGVTLSLNDSRMGFYYGGDTAVFDVRWSFGDLF